MDIFLYKITFGKCGEGLMMVTNQIKKVKNIISDHLMSLLTVIW